MNGVTVVCAGMHVRTMAFKELMHAHARDIDQKLIPALFTGVSYVKAYLVKVSKYIRHRFVHARLT